MENIAASCQFGYVDGDEDPSVHVLYLLWSEDN